MYRLRWLTFFGPPCIWSQGLLYRPHQRCTNYKRDLTQRQHVRPVKTSVLYFAVCGPKFTKSLHHRARSGGARVFAARGKCLCCRPPSPSGVFRNLKRYILGVHFQKFSNFSIFFTVNISTNFSHPKVPRRRGSPLDTPLAPPIRSAIDILMVTTMAIMQWCGL